MTMYGREPVTPEDEGMLSLINQEIVPHDYRIRCRNCRYSKRFGRTLFTARVKCASHGTRLVHAVDLLDNDVVIHSFLPNMPQLPLDGSPPF